MFKKKTKCSLGTVVLLIKKLNSTVLTTTIKLIINEACWFVAIQHIKHKGNTLHSFTHTLFKIWHLSSRDFPTVAEHEDCYTTTCQ